LSYLPLLAHINIVSAPLPKDTVNICLGNISQHHVRIGESKGRWNGHGCGNVHPVEYLVIYL